MKIKSQPTQMTKKVIKNKSELELNTRSVNDERLFQMLKEYRQAIALKVSDLSQNFSIDAIEEVLGNVKNNLSQISDDILLNK
jgi:hypothetical protein